MTCAARADGTACFSGPCTASGVCFQQFCYLGTELDAGSSCTDPATNATGSCQQSTCVPLTTTAPPTTTTPLGPSCDSKPDGVRCLAGVCRGVGICLFSGCVPGAVSPNGTACALASNTTGVCYFGTCVHSLPPTTVVPIAATTTQHTTVTAVTSSTMASSMSTQAAVVSSCNGHVDGTQCSAGPCVATGTCLNGQCSPGLSLPDNTPCMSGGVAATCHNGLCQATTTVPPETTLTTVFTTTFSLTWANTTTPHTPEAAVPSSDKAVVGPIIGVFALVLIVVLSIHTYWWLTGKNRVDNTPTGATAGNPHIYLVPSTPQFGSSSTDPVTSTPYPALTGVPFALEEQADESYGSPNYKPSLADTLLNYSAASGSRITITEDGAPYVFQNVPTPIAKMINANRLGSDNDRLACHVAVGCVVMSCSRVNHETPRTHRTIVEEETEDESYINIMATRDE